MKKVPSSLRSLCDDTAFSVKRGGAHSWTARQGHLHERCWGAAQAAAAKQVARTTTTGSQTALGDVNPPPWNEYVLAPYDDKRGVY